jgi:hypothetical protein
VFPCDKVIVLACPAHRETSTRQEALHTSSMKQWAQICDYYEPIADVRTDEVPTLRSPSQT